MLALETILLPAELANYLINMALAAGMAYAAGLMAARVSRLLNRAQSGSLAVKAMLADGKPASGVTVSLAPELTRQPHIVWQTLLNYSAPILGVPTKTDADGQFRFEALGEGRYTVSAVHPAKDSAHVVEIRAGKESRVEVEAEANPDGVRPLRLPQDGSGAGR